MCNYEPFQKGLGWLFRNGLKSICIYLLGEYFQPLRLYNPNTKVSFTGTTGQFSHSPLIHFKYIKYILL